MIKYIVPKEEFKTVKALSRSAGRRLTELMFINDVDDTYIAKIVNRERSVVARYRTGTIEMPKDVIVKLSKRFGVSNFGLWVLMTLNSQNHLIFYIKKGDKL